MHIINGHVPVERMAGESPVKCNGKLILIDGGFSKTYRRKTEIDRIINGKSGERMGYRRFSNRLNKRIKIIKGKEEEIELQLSEFDKTTIPVRETEIDKFEYNINTVTQLKAPVFKNQKVGTLTIKLNDNIIETVDIKSSKEINKKSWEDYFKNNIKFYFYSNWYM